MGDHKERMRNGELYLDSDPELVAERRTCQSLLDAFNSTTAEQEAQRRALLTELLGGIGAGSWVCRVSSATTDTSFGWVPTAF